MDTLFLCNTKTLKEKINTKVFAGDNKITKINVQIPDNIGGYPKRECEFNLRAIIPEGNLSYMINPSQPYFYITNDITEKAQTVKLMMIITHAGNVIGRTNTVDLIVNEPAEAPEPPLTPREEFDEVIAEQRAEIAEQAETISEQETEIEAKDRQISELNGQVTGLEAKNAEQAQTITRQNTTIDELNRRVPPLQQLDPINPSDIQQTLNPESPNIGFPQVIVNPVTAEGINFHPEYYKEGEECVGEVGTYNPFPEQSYGGMYVTAKDDGFPTELTIDSWDGQGQGFNFNYDNSIFRGKIKSLVFRNCNNISFLAFNLANQIDQAPYFDGWGSLENLYIDGVQNLRYSPFCNAPLLKSVYVSDKTSIIGSGGWAARGFLGNTPALETLRLPTGLTLLPYSFLSGSGIKEFTIPNTVTHIYDFVLDGHNYHGLQTLHIPNSVISIGDNNVFRNQSDLKNVTIENGFNCNNLRLNASTLYSVETIVSWLEALADRTGETAYTLTIGTTNLNKLTAEQRAIATNKNWNLV